MDLSDMEPTAGEAAALSDDRDDRKEAPHGRFQDGTPKDPNNPDHQPFPT